MNHFDFSRLEAKVDNLTEAVTKLVLFEERQTVQAASITSLTARLELAERKLDTWINRGVGMWSAVCVAWVVFKTFVPT